MTKNVEFATFMQTVMITTVLLITVKVHKTSSKAGSGINILYLLTGPIDSIGLKAYTKLLQGSNLQMVKNVFKKLEMGSEGICKYLS